MLMPLTGGTPRAVPGRGRQHSRLVSRRHPPRVFLQTQPRRSHLCRGPHRRRRRARSFAPGVHEEPQSGLVTRRPMDLLRARIGAAGRDGMDVWRIRPSGGSPERLTEQHAAVNFLAPLDPRTLLYVARAEDRSGPWLWALDVETQGDTPRAVRASISTRRCRPAATVGASSPPSPTPAPACGACRCSIGSPTSTTRSRTRCRADGAGARPALRRDVAVLSVLPRDGRRAVEGPGRTGVRSPDRASDGALSEPPAVSPDGQPRGRRRQAGGETAPVDHVGRRHGRTNRWPRPSTSKARRARALRTGRRTARGS